MIWLRRDCRCGHPIILDDHNRIRCAVCNATADWRYGPYAELVNELDIALHQRKAS